MAAVTTEDAYTSQMNLAGGVSAAQAGASNASATLAGAAPQASVTGASAEDCYKFADEMMEARDPEETVGLPAIKKRTRK